MATITNFDEALKEYCPNKMFREELKKMDWFLSNIESDENWVSDELEVRFKGSTATTVKHGSLTAAADINQSKAVKGLIQNQPEVWGSLIFNHKDIMRHGKFSEQNFMKILPDEIDDFLRYMRRAISISFTNGPVLASVTDSTDAATGVFKIDRIERLELDAKYILKDSDSPAVEVFVIELDMSEDTATFSLSRGGAAANLSAYTAANDAVFYLDGAEDASNRLTSLKHALLSYANGGTQQLYGKNKIQYPYTQAINVDGSSISQTNALEKLFLAQMEVRRKGKGNPNTCLMSNTSLGYLLAILQKRQGAYRQADDLNITEYGYSTVKIAGPRGWMNVVGVEEMDDDYIILLDKSSVKVYSNGFIRKRQSPDGKEYFEIRNTNGYQYIVDISFFGDMVLERPSRSGIVYNIPWSAGT